MCFKNFGLIYGIEKVKNPENTRKKKLCYLRPNIYATEINFINILVLI